MISLKCENISKHYNQTLLEKVNFVFSGQGVIGFIGDNGTGKSTLLKILAGVDSQFIGKFQWNDVTSVGYMPQELIGNDSLSGGQKKIEKLAELLYSNYYDVVLLDEPDNHLDFDGKEWLAEALRNFPGLVLMISHDRDFLEKTTDYVWLLEEHQIRTFPFGYKKFEQVYEEEQSYQEKLYKTQQKEKKKLEELVHRFRNISSYNSKKSATYHNMIKRLDRHNSEAIDDPKKKLASIHLGTDQGKRLINNKTAILVKDLVFSYKDKVVFDLANLHLHVHEKVTLVAPNGSGKSTLIKLLLSKLTPNSGVAKIGEGLNVGYYSQEHHETLDNDSTPLKAFLKRYPLYEYQVEAILRKFLFTKQTMRAKIDILSGGQKARLQLALFLYQNPDILILDEPTNHLDIKSIKALEHFLKQFKGAVLLISHDKVLINSVTENIYTIERGKIKHLNDSI